MDDPSVSLEGDVTTAEAKEQEVQTEQPRKTQEQLVAVKKEKVEAIKASKSSRKSQKHKMKGESSEKVVE